MTVSIAASHMKNKVIEESLKYFDNNDIATDTWVRKYALRSDQKDENGELMFAEKNPEEMWRRLSVALASIEKDKDKWESIFYRELKDFRRLVLGGSPMAGLGNHKKVSLSNCLVIPSARDSIKSIMDSIYKMAQIQAYRGGVGVDISNLRPEGSPVGNAALTSSGAWSWCDLYSFVTRIIGQNGRSGALMITMRVDHPDIFQFVRMKSDLSKVTGANVSVKITNEFMEAVEKDTDFELWFDFEDGKYENIRKKIRARDLWDSITAHATKYAEPGILMWDNIIDNSPADAYVDEGFETISTNPCCVTYDTKLLTDNGYVTVGELWRNNNNAIIESNNLGSLKIINRNGIVDSTGVFLAGINVKVYEVKFSNKAIINVTANHKFILEDNSRVITSELKIGDKVPLIDGGFATIESVKYSKVADVYCLTEYVDNEVVFNGIVTGNSEIPLCGNDSCRLASINLSSYVDKPFTKNAKFNYDEFRETIKVGVRALDNIVDLDQLPFKEIEEMGQKGRRIGLGTHGLADCLIKLNAKYDSDKAIDVVNNIYEFMANESYDASIELAIEKGPFKIWNPNKEESHLFLSRLRLDLLDKMKKYGRRNIAILTCAPTGSISIISRTSSGIEPIFRTSYDRRIKITKAEDKSKADYVDATGDSWKTYTVYHPLVTEFLGKNNPSKEDIENLPDVFVTSDKIDWKRRIDLQGVMQKWIDHGISSTINLPKGTDKSVVGNLYKRAWQEGLKGVTVYVDGSRDGVLLTEKPSSITRRISPERPDELDAVAHIVGTNGHTYNVYLGFLGENIFEVFAVKKSLIGIVVADGVKGKIVKRKSKIYDFVCENATIKHINKHEDNEIAAFTRLLSTSLRHGVPLEAISDQLSKSKGTVSSLAKAINRVISQYIIKETEVNETCEKCHHDKLVIVKNCKKCPKCGWASCS